MDEGSEFLVRAVTIGAGATVVMDLWALLLRRAFGMASLDYALVGRWIGHFPQGRFAHQSIMRAGAVRGERLLGWCAHYAIGIVFAVTLLAATGLGWARHPTLLPALLFGLLTIVVPFFVMQPAFGMGVAASRTPRPRVARLRSLMTHLVFGFGLYAAAWLAALVASA